MGRDLNSEEVAEDETPSWQVLYTTFVHTCSPLRSGDSLLPIPLYRNPPTFNGDHKAVLKWQTEWQACDEVQMGGGCRAEHATLTEISDTKSVLFKRGWGLRGRIEFLTKIPTYYYLYRVGGISLKAEKERKCPQCGGEWLLDAPIHDIFYFKCDDCRSGVKHLLGSPEVTDGVFGTDRLTSELRSIKKGLTLCQPLRVSIDCCSLVDYQPLTTPPWKISEAALYTSSVW